MSRLAQLYLLLLAGVVLGVILSRCTPRHTPRYLGRFLFWIGIPYTILVFFHDTLLTNAIWVSPLIAWVAMLLGLLLGWGWLRSLARRSHSGHQVRIWQPATQGSFLLVTITGNTGFLGFPVALTLAGSQVFGWALLYDLLGSAIGTFGLGVAVATHYGGRGTSVTRIVRQLLKNPPLWSLPLGFYGRALPIPPSILSGLQSLAWAVIFASLLLIGMRLGQIRHWQGLGKLLPSLGIKMLVVPLLMGLGLTAVGIDGLARLVLVLQAGMPPAFSSLVLAEIYHLDRELSVLAVVGGTLGLLGVLPLWVALFGG